MSVHKNNIVPFGPVPDPKLKKASSQVVSLPDFIEQKEKDKVKQRGQVELQKKFNKRIHRGINSLEKASKVVGRLVHKYKAQILTGVVLAGTTGFAYTQHVNNTAKATAIQQKKHLSTAELEQQDKLQERKVGVYQREVTRILETGDLSYRPIHTEALENPMYGHVIKSTIERPIGPKTLTLNHEAMAQKAKLAPEYTNDLIHAAKFIVKYQDIFQYAAKRVDMPWQLLASIAERENHMHYILSEDHTWQDFDEIEAFRHSYSNGMQLNGKISHEESEATRTDMGPLVDSIPNLSTVEREELKGILPLWIADVERNVLRDTNHKLYKQLAGLHYNSHDIAAMLGYGEIHNSLYDRTQGRVSGYVWAGTNLKKAGKHLRNNAVIGHGRFFYDRDFKDPQQGIFPTLRLVMGIPENLPAEKKENLLAFFSSHLKKEK